MGVALLAPVPSLHLESSLKTCQEHGKVAFGSMLPQVFERLTGELGQLNVPVYIYASSHHGPPFDHVEPGKVSLRGILCNVVHANDRGAHPDPRYRPDSTFDAELGGFEQWWCFWEVSELRVLTTSERIPLTKFVAYGQKKALRSGFVPKGPMIVKGAFIP
jgi:hypothetical protein